MTLLEYLAQTKTTQRQLAEALGVHPAQVTRWVRGERLPDLETVARIEAATGKAVTAEDWIAPLRGSLPNVAA